MNILDEEKKRIISMHLRATERQYLPEQSSSATKSSKSKFQIDYFNNRKSFIDALVDQDILPGDKEPNYYMDFFTSLDKFESLINQINITSDKDDSIWSKIASVVGYLSGDLTKEYILNKTSCDKLWAKQSYPEVCLNNKFPSCLIFNSEVKTSDMSLFNIDKDKLYWERPKEPHKGKFIFSEDGSYIIENSGGFGYITCDGNKMTWFENKKTPEKREQQFKEGGSGNWSEWLEIYPCLNTVPEWKNTPPQMYSNNVDGKKMYFIKVKNTKNNIYYRFYSDGVITDINGNDTYKKFKCGSNPNTGELNTQVIVEGLRNIKEQIGFDVDNKNSSTSTTTTEPVRDENKIPYLLGNEEGIKSFQDWLDNTKKPEGWDIIGKNPQKGYGIYKGKTKEYFEKYRAAYRDFILAPYEKKNTEPQKQQPTPTSTTVQKPSDLQQFLSNYEEIK